MYVVIVGSGVAGRLLAHALVERGDQVSLISPRAPHLPALWMAGDAVSGKGFRAGLSGADVMVYAAAGRQGKEIEQVGTAGAEQACRAALRAEIPHFLLLGPTGAGVQAPSRHLQAHAHAVDLCARRFSGLQVLQLPLLFGEGDLLLSPWLAQAREGGAMAVRHGKLEVRPLFVRDAAALMLAALDGKLPERVSVQGPERTTVGELAAHLARRFQVSQHPLFWRSRPTGDDLQCLKAQLQGKDDWTGLGLPERTGPNRWISRLDAPIEGKE